MSEKVPVISRKRLIKLLEKTGSLLRVSTAHHRMKHADGRVTTIPVHKNDDLPKGLLRKIIRDDLGFEMDEFVKLIKEK